MAAVGAAMQLYSQVQASEAKSEAQRREAELKNMQADELAQRQLINEQVMRSKEARTELYAGSDGGSGNTGLGTIMQLRQDLRQNIDITRRESDWKIRMLHMGANADTQLAGDIQQAGMWGAIGGALSFAGQAYSPMKAGSAPSGDTKDLPGLGDASTGTGYSNSGAPILGGGAARQPILPPGY